MWVLPKQAMSSVSTLSPHAKHLAMSVRTEVPATHFQGRVCPGGQKGSGGVEQCSLSSQAGVPACPPIRTLGSGHLYTLGDCMCPSLLGF